MPATIKKMGKVAASPFGALTKGTAAKPNNKPILIMIVVGGVAVIWYLRNHSSSNTVGSSTTNPAVSINGGTAPDQSTIDNLTASILALQGQVYNSTTTPSGGASTPITTTPINTTPAAAVVNNPTPAVVATSTNSWSNILASNVPGSAADVATASGGATYVDPFGVSHTGNSVQSTLGPAGVTPAMYAQIDQSINAMYGPNGSIQHIVMPTTPVPSNLINPKGAV